MQDTVYRTQHLPRPGESVFVDEIQQFLGGKGTNQAIAAARLGAQVSAIGMLGEDEVAEKFLEVFRAAGINTQHIHQTPKAPTGQASITVQADGLNQISVFVGANLMLRRSHIQSAGIRKEDLALCQFEVLDEVIWEVAQSARLILNPAPFRDYPADLLKNVWALTPNETEAESLTGVQLSDNDSFEFAAGALHERGVPIVILTLGSKGAFVSSPDFTGLIPAPRVRALDTTAAGDVFNGALANALWQELAMKDAVSLAVKAASYSVTRPGALNSAPTVDELRAFSNDTHQKTDHSIEK